MAAISCRKSHLESATGGYVPVLNDDGTHKQREGYMVGCDTDLDCYSRCGGAFLYTMYNSIHQPYTFWKRQNVH